jgi:hypothetical protein
MMSATNYFEKPAFSPEAGVVTVRPSSTALLTIDSEDRFSNYPQERLALGNPTGNAYNQSPYNFEIVKNESIMNGYFTRLGLTEISFPWTIPNINPKTQEIIVNWSVSGGASGSNIVTLAQPDFLKPKELAAQLQSMTRSANTNLSSMVIGYGNDGVGPLTNIPQFYYFSGVTGANAVFMSWSPMPYNSAQYPYPDTTKQLFDLLGFTSYNSTVPPVLTGRVGKPTLCQATRYVDIVCSQLTYNQPLKDTTTQTIARDSLCRLYLGDANGFGTNFFAPDDSNFCPPGCAPTVLYRQFQTPKMINWNSAGKAYQPVPGVLRFEVFDDAGANLGEMCSSAIVPGSSTAQNPEFTDWSATILVSEN